MACFVGKGLFKPLHVSPDAYLCFQELVNGHCNVWGCPHVHLEQLKHKLMDAKEYVECLLTVLPLSLHYEFRCQLTKVMAGQTWTALGAMIAIAGVYQSVLDQYPRVISESLLYDNLLEDRINWDSVLINSSLLYLEMELIKFPNRATLLHTWYRRATNGRVHDDRILSVFMHVLTGEFGRDLISDWHIVICRHYGRDLLLRMHNYRPPIAMMLKDGRVLSSYLNSVVDDPYRVKALFPADFKHNAVTAVAMTRFLCEHGGGLSAAMSFLSRHTEWSLSWDHSVVVKLFNEHVCGERGLYTHWFQPVPYQYALDPQRYPIITDSVVCRQLLQAAPADANPSLTRWLLDCLHHA